MKSFIRRSILILLAMAVAYIVPAQNSLKSTTSGNTLDTVTGTTVRIMALSVNGYNESVTATINVTKISGTLGGTMVPVASNDGVNFYDISQASKDTVAIANSASQGKNYSFQRGWKWYGVQWTGTGTMSGSVNGKLLALKPSY